MKYYQVKPEYDCKRYKAFGYSVMHHKGMRTLIGGELLTAREVMLLDAPRAAFEVVEYNMHNSYISFGCRYNTEQKRHGHD